MREKEAIYNNIAFLEEYKQLDAFCKRLLGTEEGITEYIRRMDATPQENRKVKDWDTVVRNLVSLRKVRNRLVHDVGTLEQETATEADIRLVQAYSTRFAEQRDPLTSLRMRREGKEKKEKKGSLWSRIKAFFTGRK
ncbi:MAG: hypothetical protein LUE27_08365 [Clostridia bacterium]|nr:hypothetical protein [Clostridia bacterium]